jgi:hypothetical protein
MADELVNAADELLDAGQRAAPDVKIRVIIGQFAAGRCFERGGSCEKY